MTELFFHKVKKNYFLVLEPGSEKASCLGCAAELFPADTAVLQRQHWIRAEKLWCVNCAGKAERQVVDEYFSVLITLVVPSNSLFVPFERPIFGAAKDVTVWDAARKESVHETDNTVHALRGSFEGAVIGAPDMAAVDRLDAPVSSEAEAALLLEGLQRAEPVLPAPQDKPRLEGVEK